MSTTGQANVCTTTETENESPTNTCDLETIKIEIKKYQESSNEAYLEIGRLLLKVKEIEAHGRWIPWIKENTDFSICKAQRLMRIAKWIDGNEAPVPHLDFSKAYILSRLTGNDLETFLQRFHHVGGKCAKNVESMTKTELAKAVHNYLKSKGHKSSSDQGSQQAESHTSTEDDFLNRFDRIKSDVSKLASLVEDNSAGYGNFATELCELCQEIIQQLSSDDVEDS